MIINCCGCKKEIEAKKHIHPERVCKKCYNVAHWAKPQTKLRRSITSRTLYRKKNGIPLDAPIVKKGSGSLDKKTGYVNLGIQKNGKSTTIMMHRRIMELFLGRELTKKETVHHINGIRSDNRIENLELWHSGHPKGQRLEDKLKWAIDLLQEYGYKVNK